MDCPLYAEGRNLDAWEIVREERALNFARVLDDEEKFSAFRRFCQGPIRSETGAAASGGASTVTGWMNVTEWMDDLVHGLWCGVHLRKREDQKYTRE